MSCPSRIFKWTLEFRTKPGLRVILLLMARDLGALFYWKYAPSRQPHEEQEPLFS